MAQIVARTDAMQRRKANRYWVVLMFDGITAVRYENDAVGWLYIVCGRWTGGLLKEGASRCGIVFAGGTFTEELAAWMGTVLVVVDRLTAGRRACGIGVALPGARDFFAEWRECGSTGLRTDGFTDGT